MNDNKVNRKTRFAYIIAVEFIVFMFVINFILTYVMKVAYLNPYKVNISVYFQIFLAVFTFVIYRIAKVNMKVDIYRQVKAENRRYIYPLILFMFIMIITFVMTLNLKKINFDLMSRILMTCFLIAISQEIIFRGVIFELLKDSKGIYRSIMISTVMYTLMSMSIFLTDLSFSMKFMYVVANFFTGLLLMTVFYRIENINQVVLYRLVYIFMGSVSAINANRMFIIVMYAVTGFMALIGITNYLNIYSDEKEGIIK